MTGIKAGRPAGAGITLSVLLAAGGACVRAQPPVIPEPEQAVGGVVLGMRRADVWKVLRKPAETHTVAHGGELYGEDDWTGGGHRLTVISEHGKVIQVEFDSPRLHPTDGLTMETLTTRSTLAQVRRRHPAMAVRLYALEADQNSGSDGYYLDDVRQGIAFTISTQEGIEASYLNSPPSTIIIHRAGHRAVPVYMGHWSAPMPNSESPESLRLLRSWFTPGGARRGGNG